MLDRIRNVPQPTSKTAKINVIPPRSIIEICYFIFRIPPKTPLELKVLSKFEIFEKQWGMGWSCKLKNIISQFL